MDTKKDFLDETIDLWQSHCAGVLDDAAATVIVGNIAGFLDTLLRWHRCTNPDGPETGLSGERRSGCNEAEGVKPNSDRKARINNRTRKGGIRSEAG